MRHYLEAAASTLIEVDPYKRGQKLPSVLGRQANIYDVEFSGDRGHMVYIYADIIQKSSRKSLKTRNTS